MRVGDYVKLDSGEEGYVVAFSWRSTRVRMLSNNVIIVPNARLSQAIVTNYHLRFRDLAVLVDPGATTRATRRTSSGSQSRWRVSTRDTSRKAS